MLSRPSLKPPPAPEALGGTRHSTGVEIGVQRGLYSELILSESRLSKLILVDPWRELDDGYRDIATVAQREHDRALAEAKRRLAPFGERAGFWRTTSLQAATTTSDARMDSIYLDARHDYEAVMDDLRAWYPKLRPGGVFAGHDYVDGDLPEGVFGVRSAVDDFYGGRCDVVVYATFAERWPTWIAAPPSRHPRGIAATSMHFRGLFRRSAAEFGWCVGFDVRRCMCGERVDGVR